MSQFNLTPYEGDGNFLFISYAHKDSDRVLPILEALYNRGYQIWYDDGIAPGSEWPEYIARHLSNSSVVMAFISPASIASANCRREITYALAKEKPFLGVILEETQMSPGMELQLSAQQCVLKYKYSSDEEFTDKLCSMPELAACRVIIPVVEKDSVDTATDQIPPPISDSDMEIVDRMVQAEGEESAVADEQPTEGRDTKTIKAAKKRSKTVIAAKDKAKPKGKLMRILGLSVATIALVIVAAIAIPAALKVEVFGQKFKRDTTNLTVRSQVVTNADLKAISKLKELSYISFTDCVFSGASMRTLNSSGITSLAIDSCTGLEFSFLEEMTELTKLTIKDSGMITDSFNAAALTNLLVVDFSGNETLNTLPTFVGSGLQRLNISDTAIEDVSAIAKYENLREFDAANTAIQDVSALAGLTNLETVNLSGTPIEDDIPVFQSLSIKKLDVSNTKLTTMEAFENLTVLETLNISNTGVTAAACIEKSQSTLKELYLSGNDVFLPLIFAIKACTGITILDISGVTIAGDPIRDLSITANMQSLTELYAVGCGITDISALSCADTLSKAVLSDNAITDISTLQSYSALTILALDHNQITDISCLPTSAPTCLYLQGNEINFNTVPYLDKDNRPTYTVITYNDGLLAGKIEKGNSFVDVWLIDCPADKQLFVTDLIGNAFLTLCDEDFVARHVAEDGYYIGKWSAD